MKKLLLILLCLPMIGFGQSVPQGINYQAVARDANGDVLMNQILTIQFSIISDITTSAVSWQETHTVSTNIYGLYTAIIGGGATTSVGSSAAFDSISWGASNHLLKVELDYGGGLIDMGTTAFMSVPYALFAETSNNAGPQAIQGVADQTLYHNGTDWISTSNLSNNGTNATTDADMNINGITLGKGGGNILSNTASGHFALYSNTAGDNNTSSGNYALYSNIWGWSNTATGSQALYSNAYGSNNTASGYYALYSNYWGGANTALGNYALYSNIWGDHNTASGHFALYSNTIGYKNTASGQGALNSNTAGDKNTATGSQALNSNTTGSNNIGIGYDAVVPSDTSDNQVRIGNANITYAGIQVAWTITSDKRWKSDIQNSSLGLNFISKLRPVSYYRNNDESKKIEYGFIAQELEAVLNNAGAINNGIISKDEEGMYGVRYNDLMATMVKAIQEQQEMINTLQQENKEFKERIVQLEKN